MPFKRALVKIPIQREEDSSEELEAYIHKFLKGEKKELYISYPFQNEAFPTTFEDENFVF